MIIMTSLLQVINNAPNGVSLSGNLFYLLLSRPVFIAGFTMMIFPVMVGSEVFQPLKQLLSHNFWVPFSRLSYGAYLSHGVFMQFREYNIERGQWACGFDAFLFFFAYLGISFIFSTWMAVAFDLPLGALYYEYVSKPKKR